MKVYTVTRILKNKEGKEFLHDVIRVYADKAKALAEAKEMMDDIQSTHPWKIKVEHRNETATTESYTCEWIGWKNFTDYSSEKWEITEFEVYE